MARVLLTTTAPTNDPYQPYARSNFERLRRGAQCDRFAVHSLTEDPEQADIILFVGSGSKYHADIKTSALVRQYPTKCFVYDEQDNAIPSLPGVYVGLTRSVALTSPFRCGFYLRVSDNDRIVCEDISVVRYLYTFTGRVANSPVREALLELRHSRGLVVDRHSGQSDKDVTYAALLTESKFVLCPRGVGPSTWRLYETMKAGRVPIILSDEWVPPSGPAWHDFSIRIPEREYRTIPTICEILEDRAGQMGQKARKTWEDWFSLESAFHQIVEWCLAINFEMKGIQYRIPSRFMPFRSLNRRHFRPFWREYFRDRLVSLGMWNGGQGKVEAP